MQFDNNHCFSTVASRSSTSAVGFLRPDLLYPGSINKEISPSLSLTPNDSEQLFNNYPSLSIPNDQFIETTPPNIFTTVPQDSFSYFNIPSPTKEPNFVVGKGTLEKILSKYANQNVPFEIPNGSSSDSSIDAMLVDDELGDNFFANFVNDDMDAQNDFMLTSQDDVNFTPSSTSCGNPLPNAIPSSQVFPILNTPSKLHQKFSTEWYKKYPEIQSRIKALLVPMWTSLIGESIWISIFNKFDCKVYFSFFMDCSLNIILKICNKSIHSGTNWTCFDSHILEQLTRKSYIYYGTLIKDLRESITHSDPEYCTTVSWYSGFSLILHTHTTVDSLSLIYTGSTSLWSSVMEQCKSMQEIPPTLQVLTHLVKSDVAASMIPDYSFEVIKELYRDFVQFKMFINYNPDLTSQKNGYILKAYIEVENFLDTLINDIYPQLKSINDSYKSKYMVQDKTNSLIFISPSLLFDLLVRWFNVIPSYALAIGEKMSPLKRTFYLFIPAIGYAMTNVFPLLRTVMLVDPLHILHPFADFNNKLYQFSEGDVSSPQQYKYLYNLTTKLLRMINFFIARQLIIGHYLQANFNFEVNHLLLVDPINSDSRKVLRIVPPKLDTNEVEISNFGINTIINLNNYPMINSFYNWIDKDYKQIVEYENHDQKVRIKEFRSRYQDIQASAIDETFIENDNRIHDFDYETGLFTFDYKIHPLMKLYNEQQKKRYPETTLESIKTFISYFKQSVQEIRECIPSTKE